MKIEMDYKDAINDLQSRVNMLSEKTEANITGCLSKIGSIVALTTGNTAKRSDKEYYWSKGEKKKNTHIADDVVYVVKRGRKTKSPYVTISGGSKTWPKWILANDGHVAENGKFVPGNHFVDKAARLSEEKVDSVIDEFLKGIIS